MLLSATTQKSLAFLEDSFSATKKTAKTCIVILWSLKIITCDSMSVSFQSQNNWKKRQHY